MPLKQSEKEKTTPMKQKRRKNLFKYVIKSDDGSFVRIHT